MAFLVGLLLTSCGGVAAKKETRLPDATLGALRKSDRPAKLRDLRGPMVVNLWANWCKPCRTEMPIYQQFHQKHPAVKVIG
ncbi:MAG: TlpA family protein disulfide reductase, partial [Actinomycetota bacterium]|nr:TlpA family protein disulfide reductase [Actinomycetota bacterium]